MYHHRLFVSEGAAVRRDSATDVVLFSTRAPPPFVITRTVT